MDPAEGKYVCEEVRVSIQEETTEVEITCGNDGPIHHQVRVYRNRDGGYHLSCLDCDWWATGIRVKEPATKGTVSDGGSH